MFSRSCVSGHPRAAESAGYASWTAYLADVLGETPMRLERDVRQELVAELHSQGMSSRAIAPIVGATDRTVRNDISGGKHFPPTPLDAIDRDAAEAIAATEPPPVDADPLTPGKSSRPTPSRGTCKVLKSAGRHG